MTASLWPVLRKEFRTQLRGGRAPALITLFVGLLFGAMLLMYRSVTSRLEAGAPLVNAQIGQALFTGLALAVQILTVFLAPASTVDLVSREHEQDTLDMLLVMPLGTVQVLWGKLLAALAFLLLLLLATLPLFSTVVLFGGMQLIDIARVLLTILMSALMGSLLGLFCSAATKQTYTATMTCYAILISLVGGTLFAANLWSATHSLANAPPTYVVANPLSALASALAGATPPAVITPGTLGPLAILGLLTQGTIRQGGAQPTVLPLYRATWLLYGLLTLVLFWLSIHLVRPRRRWRFARSDWALLVIVGAYIALAWLSQSWWRQGLRPL